MSEAVTFTVRRISPDDPQRMQAADKGDVVTELSKNARLHWRVRATRTKKWRRRAWEAWYNAGAKKLPLPVLITFTVRRARKCDEGNARGAMDAILDGLTGTGDIRCPLPGMLPDDSYASVQALALILEVDKRWRGKEEVVVHVQVASQPRLQTT